MDRIEPQVPSAPRPDGQDSTSERLLSRRHFVRRVGLAGATLAVAGPVLAACGTTSTSTSARSGGSSSKPTGNRKKIGFSQPDTSASIWGPLMLGAKLQCQARGYELLESHANSQLSAQLSEIQTWIAEGVGAIVALPLDNNAIIPLIKSAHAKGVKFLDYSDNALPGVDGWVIFDNLQGAKLVGQYAGQWVNQTLGGKAQVALLTHQIQLTGKQRIEGCVSALQAVAPGAKVADQSSITGGDPGRWRAVVETNVLGVAHSLRAVAPEMARAGSGDIVVIASASGRDSYVGEPLYIASKWGVVGMGHAVRKELAASNIRVTLIEPGLVDTPLTRGSPVVRPLVEAGGALLPEDIAEAVTWLISRPRRVSVTELVIRPTSVADIERI